MPLPTTDSVAFRGVPSLGAERKMALTMTLTQKQVEAIFARQSALRELNSSQYPFEIDFDDNKIYIGDIATPFSSFKEDGTREICQRSPTVSKPLAGISLSGIVIAKLNLHRDFDQDIADSVRKATEAEHSKRNERTIVRLNSPPVLSNGKKSKSASGVSTLAKKAMSNRIVSAQVASNHNRPPTSIASSSAANPRPKPSTLPAKSTPPSRSLNVTSKPSASTTSSTPPSTSPKEPDFTSLRARMIHYLAINTPTTQEVLLEMGGRNPSPETTREIEDALTAVAQEKPPPKKAPAGPVSWELQLRSWEHVQPYEWPGLTADQRIRMARKGRLACTQMNVPLTDPLWQRFEFRVSDASTSPAPDKGKITSGQLHPKKPDFKGGMFPKEKKPGTKGGVTNGAVTKTKKASSSKPKSQKDKVDEVEAKVRKVVDGLTPKASGKGKGNLTSAAKVSSKKDEEEAFTPNGKARSSLGSTKREASPVLSRSRHAHEEVVHKRKLMDVDIDAMSEMEEGELIMEPDAKKRKVAITGESNKLKTQTKSESHDSLTRKSVKETKKKLAKEDSLVPKVSKDPRAGIDTSSSSRSSSSGSKVQRLDNEEREREEKEREKRRLSGKRTRRATPSFSSDEEEEEERPKKVTTHTRVPASAGSKPKPPPHPPSSKLATPATKSQAVPSSRVSAPSPPLPSEKEALRRRYHICYARYMGVTSKFYEQRAKVEALLAADGESVSADEDMMDTEQLIQLRSEHERLKDELERILHAHANAMVF